MKSTRCGIIILSSLCLFLLMLGPIGLDDIYMYLALGRRFFMNGEFGGTDPYIFTIPNYAWDLWHEWLSYLFYYSLFVVGDYKGVIYFRALIAVVGLVFIFRAAIRSKLSDFSTLAIAMASIYVAYPRLIRDRSSIFSDIFTVLLIFFFSAQSTSKKIDCYKWSIPFLFMLWAQLHPGFVLGWLLLGLYVISKWPLWDKVLRRKWVFVFVASILVTAIHPTGFEAAIWPVQKLFSSDWEFFRHFNYEWMNIFSTPNVSHFQRVFLVGFMAVTLVATARNIKANWYPFAVTLIMAYLGISAVRFLGLVGLSLGVLLANSAATIDAQWCNLDSKYWRGRWTKIFTLLIPILVSAIFLGWNGVPAGLTSHPLHPAVPVKAMMELKRYPRSNVFNSWETGAYLIWELGDRQKIAAHGFISDAKLAEEKYHRFSYTREDWDRIILGNDVDYFFITRENFEDAKAANASWFNELSGPQWRQIYLDPAAVIYQRVK